MSSGWRLGIDTGGTFADVVAYHPVTGTLHVGKSRSDADPAEVLDDSLAASPLGNGAGERVEAVVHGTTRITNAILEGRASRVALVTTRGFRDLLAIARQAREHLYDLRRPARAGPAVPRELCFEVDERIAPDGAVLRALDRDELERLVAALVEAEVEAVAVCLLNAYADPRHELEIAASLAERWPVSLSHQISAERREYERGSTTALNAGVLRLAGRYFEGVHDAVSERFPGSRLYIVHSAGGMVTTELVRSLPLTTVMSGPAAGAAAAARLARRLGLERCVSLDMGGTSTDVSLIRDGRVSAARDRRLGGHAVRLPAVDVESVPTGGGSIARVDDVGALRVGPRSAGASPGPACFGQGGEQPTVTDADLVLGLIDPESRLSGIAVDPGLARAALEPLAQRLGLGVEAAAAAVLEVAHAQMDRALRLVSVQRGHDLRDCTLIAYGGGGAVHAGPLAASTGIRRVVVPPLAPVFSALGCCLSEVARERVQTRLAPLDEHGLAAARQQLDELVERELATLAGGAQDGNVVVERHVELRYRSQNDELRVAWPEPADVGALRHRFGEVHHREFGYATDEQIEITAVGCRVTIADELRWPGFRWPPSDGRREEVELRLAVDRAVAAPVVGVDRLVEGDGIAGPALIGSPFASITVWEGQRATADEDGNVILEVAA
jgi:N-methylhydantoinase A